MSKDSWYKAFREMEKKTKVLALEKESVKLRLVRLLEVLEDKVLPSLPFCPFCGQTNLLHDVKLNHYTDCNFLKAKKSTK